MIIIIGAGISGIGAANQLKQPFIILEKETQIGGLSGQYTVDDLDFDYGGHYFHFQKNPQTLNYLKNFCTFDKFKRNSKTCIFNRMIPYPVQLHLAYLPAGIRRTILQEILNRREGNYFNLHDHLYNNFGPTLFKLFFQPFLAKYYNTDLKKMVADMDRGSIPVPTKEQIIEGSRGNLFKNSGYNPVFYYPHTSLNNFMHNYASKVQSHIRLEEEAIEINLTKRTIRTPHNTYPYTYIINTMPLNLLLPKIKPALKNFRQNQLQHTSTIIANMVLSRKRRRFHWVYLADSKLPFYRLGFYPRRSGNMCYLERSVNPEDPLHERELTDDLHFTLKKLKVIEHKNEILHLNFKQIPVSYIIFNKQWHGVIPPLLQHLRENRIFSIGRYGGWNYSSMSEDTQTALETAQLINKLSG